MPRHEKIGLREFRPGPTHLGYTAEEDGSWEAVEMVKEISDFEIIGIIVLCMN